MGLSYYQNRLLECNIPMNINTDDIRLKGCEAWVDIIKFINGENVAIIGDEHYLFGIAIMKLKLISNMDISMKCFTLSQLVSLISNNKFVMSNYSVISILSIHDGITNQIILDKLNAIIFDCLSDNTTIMLGSDDPSFIKDTFRYAWSAIDSSFQVIKEKHLKRK